MKTLTIVAVILGIAFLFFIARAEKSFVINGNEVTPAGITNVPKMLLDKINETGFKISDNIGNGGIGDLISLEPISTNNIVAGVKDFISGAIDKITETIKTPIEDKVNNILCPQK